MRTYFCTIRNMLTQTSKYKTIQLTRSYYKVIDIKQCGLHIKLRKH